MALDATVKLETRKNGRKKPAPEMDFASGGAEIWIQLQPA